MSKKARGAEEKNQTEYGEEEEGETQGEKRKAESWVSAKRKRNQEGKPAWRR